MMEGMMPPAAPPPGAPVKGTVSRWTERGFGFITPEDGGEDLFCHFSNVEDGFSSCVDGVPTGAMVRVLRHARARRACCAGLACAGALGRLLRLAHGTRASVGILTSFVRLRVRQ
jgi:hypothetical protein